MLCHAAAYPPVQVLERDGFGPLEASYLASWLHTGQRVAYLHDSNTPLPTTASSSSVAAPTGAPTSPSVVPPAPSLPLPRGGPEGGGEGQTTDLTIIGVSPSGFLLAVDGAGRRYELTPDGNSLDMMQGLVRRKM